MSCDRGPTKWNPRPPRQLDSDVLDSNTDWILFYVDFKIFLLFDGILWQMVIWPLLLILCNFLTFFFLFFVIYLMPYTVCYILMLLCDRENKLRYTAIPHKIILLKYNPKSPFDPVKSDFDWALLFHENKKPTSNFSTHLISNHCEYTFRVSMVESKMLQLFLV